MEQNKPLEPQIAQRIFEQGPDSTSFYSDFAQAINTGNEIVFQFYETIPGVPGTGGTIQMVRSRLRATITVSMALAKNFSNNLLLQTNIETLKKEPPK